jgi:hypothetical protein
MDFEGYADSLGPRGYKRVFGFAREHVDLLSSCFKEKDRSIMRMTLVKLKSNLPWDTLKFFLGVDVRKRMLKFLRSYNWTLDAEIRFRDGRMFAKDWDGNDVEIFPNTFGSVDVFPVRSPQGVDGQNYNGKYKSGCFKFELWVTSSGIPFAIYGPYNGKMHDSKVLTTMPAGDPNGRKFQHYEGEGFLADKAYVGKGHLSVPRKQTKKNPYTDPEKNFIRHHRFHRSRVEHAIGRLNRFRFLRWCTHSAAVTECAVKFVTWCEHVVRRQELRQQPARPHSPFTCPCNFVLREPKPKTGKRRK